MKPLNEYIDHTLLKADASREDIRRLCDEARAHRFWSVCVNSSHVELAAQLLAGSGVKVCSVVGFPLGAMSLNAKAFETDEACRMGASEIDMVIGVGALKEGRDEYVSDDIAAVVSVASEYDAIVKVILETCYLSPDEIVRACELACQAGAAFVKTSTGFGTGGATVEDVALMKKTVDGRALVKASGGIRDTAAALRMIEAGADRLGTSASVAILLGESGADGKAGGY